MKGLAHYKGINDIAGTAFTGTGLKTRQGKETVYPGNDIQLGRKRRRGQECVEHLKEGSCPLLRQDRTADG